ncbi:Serine hydrolase [uncultured archaeon]|nr:Serine hydrolase [uncultured archaeon]
MPKRVFIIHGWEGYPEEGWFPWLKKELEAKGYIVEVPSMPESEAPDIGKWVSFLAGVVKKADKDTFFVGHSIGCQAVLRYLQTVDAKIGGAVFVAGWVSLTPMATRTKEERKIVKPWFETPIDFDRIRKTTRNFVAVFSNNDPYVPLENAETYKNRLGARIIIEKDKGHFSGSDEVTKLPVVLKELLGMAKTK